VVELSAGRRPGSTRHDGEAGIDVQTGQEPLLEVTDLSLSYGAVQALNGVSFSIHEGELFALVGPNGAGKTSLFNCLSGLERPQRGSIRMGGVEAVGRPPHKVAELGIGRMFQNLALFSNSTVLQNVMTGRHRLMDTGLLGGMLFWGRARRTEIEHRERVEEILDFLDIVHLRNERVGSLPLGLQKRIELARALASEPRLLLLDEPAMGMNVEETEDMARFILDLVQEWGTTVLLIEHDMGMVMDIAHRVMVLNFGQVLAIGRPEEVQEDPDVIAA